MGHVPPRPSARVHLRALATLGGLAERRVDAVLDLVELGGRPTASGDRFDLGAGPLAAIVVGATAYTALGTVLGGGLGWLARNQVAAAIAVFAYAMLDPPLAQAIPAYGRFGATALGVAMSGDRGVGRRRAGAGRRRSPRHPAPGAALTPCLLPGSPSDHRHRYPTPARALQ